MAWLLLPQFVALLLGGAVVAQRAAPQRVVLRRRAATLVMVAAVLAAAVGTAQILDRLLSQRSDSLEASELERATRGGREARADVAFVEWVRRRLPRGARYAVISKLRDEATYQWLAYRVYPSRVTDDVDGVDWIVFEGVAPVAANAGRPLSTVHVFRPGYALARVAR